MSRTPFGHCRAQRPWPQQHNARAAWHASRAENAGYQSTAAAAAVMHAPLTQASAESHVVVIHETDGRKYLEALSVLVQRQEISSASFHGSSVFWRFAHALLRDRLPLRQALSISLENFRFLLSLGQLRDKTVIIGLAPWDFRLLPLAVMLQGNRIIYHTSWPWWSDNRVPRKYGLFTPIFRHAFSSVLRRPGVEVVSVTQATAKSLERQIPGLRTQVISHMVSDAFFERRAKHSKPFKLLFVGELSEKKGLRDFLSMADLLVGKVELEIVGNGPLHHLAQRPGCRWHGKVTDRHTLADIVSGCQAFVSLSHRTPTWEELFGMAMVEAMAVGLPCIVTNHVGPRGIIESGVDGFLVEEGERGVAAAVIQTLIDQPDIWQSVSDAAAQTARQFSVTAVSRRWHRLLTAPQPAAPGSPLPRRSPPMSPQRL